MGKWVNPQEGEIDFYLDGTGFFPGAGEQIPSSNFTYSFTDETHIAMNVAGQLLVVEIKIEGDKMTWLSRANNIEYEYTRAK